MKKSEEKGAIRRQEINSPGHTLKRSTSAMSTNLPESQPQLLNLRSSAYISTMNRSRLDGLSFNEHRATDKKFSLNTLTPIQSQEDLASKNSNATSVYVFGQSSEKNVETSSPQILPKKRTYTIMEAQLIPQTQSKLPKPVTSTSGTAQNTSSGSPRITFSPASSARWYRPKSAHGLLREQSNRKNSPREKPQEQSQKAQHQNTCDSPRTVYPTAGLPVFNFGQLELPSPIPKNVHQPSQNNMTSNTFSTSSPRTHPVPNKFTLPSLQRAPPIPNVYSLSLLPRTPPVQTNFPHIASPFTDTPPRFQFGNEIMEQERYWGPGIQNLEITGQDVSMDIDTGELLYLT